MTNAALKYYIQNKDVESTINSYNDMDVFSSTPMGKLPRKSNTFIDSKKYFHNKLKIYSHDYSYIIKFLSHYMVINSIGQETNEKISYNELIAILENNLNTNLKYINSIHYK